MNMKTTQDLAAAHCRPLRGIEHRLSDDALHGLLDELPGWELIEAGAAIAKTFRFGNYYQTMAFVNALAFIAHREDHHPDLGVHYNRCVVRYSTHDVGGVTENDLICAVKTERLYAEAAHPGG